MGVPTADYVIVGAGSAGCALASRLSEDRANRVVVIEAGGRGRHRDVVIPIAFGNQFRTRLDWDLCTEPEPGCDGRSLYVPRGKGLGGSSSMNAMLYVRGRPLDYDLWEERGAAGWGWEGVFPYFLRSENNERGASAHHAVGGPLNVADQRSPRKLTGRFLAAAEAAGIPLVDDCNGPVQDGATIAQVTQRNGRRWSAGDAYMCPAMRRPNVDVVTRALVEAVELEGDRATAVRYRDRRGRPQVVSAAREIILSAGTIGSPQLLMLSGIGPAEHLREHGIDVAVDLPGVGANLQDHPFNIFAYEVEDGSLADAQHPKALAEWLMRRSGPLTSTVAEAFAFVRSRPGLPAADLQLHFAPTYFVEHGASGFEGHAITLCPTLISPRARGRLSLRSADPADKPRILTNSLTDDQDVAALIAGARTAREIAASGPLAEVIRRELEPGPDVEADGELEADLRRRAELLYHPVGTCAMGDGQDAVLDAELRVRGVENLRVADASVMPVIPGGNTNAPSIMVGERAADLVRGLIGVPDRAARRDPAPASGRSR